MKALFHCHHSNFSLPPVWTGSAFLLPICNKALIEYWLDLCIWLGIHDILLVHYGDEALVQHCGDGHEWGLHIQYVLGENEELPELLAHHTTFFTQDTLILDGLIFPFYDRRELKPLLLNPTEALVYYLDTRPTRFSQTAFLFPHMALHTLRSAQDERERFERWTGLPFDQHPQLQFPVRQISSLDSYFKLNIEVLSHHAQFHLKGFEVAPHIFEGIMNEIAQRPSLGGPLITGNNCTLGADVQLRNVILHDQVRLEGHTRLSNCMVWGPLYLAEVELSDCLILNQQCLNPTTGQWSPLEQPWQLQKALDDGPTRQAISQGDRRQALKLLSWRWLLYHLLRWLVPSELKKFYLNAQGDGLVLRHFTAPESPHLLQRLFFKWSLERVPSLEAVLQQRLLLVGTRLLPKSHENQQYLESLPVYAPGAFSHSESLSPDSLGHLIEELHYSSQVSETRNAEIWQEALAQSHKKWKL